MKRSTSLPKVNRARQKRRKDAGEVYGPLHEWTKTQPCILVTFLEHECHYPGRLDNESHHLKSVGSGGKDRNNVLPCCPKLHNEFHTLGLARMCELYRVDFEALALGVTADYLAEQGESLA